MRRLGSFPAVVARLRCSARWINGLWPDPFAVLRPVCVAWDGVC
jgi:hypothetical protein